MSLPTAEPVAVQALQEALSRPRKLAIVTHFDPDGDAIGSSLGLYHVLAGSGHTVQVVLPNQAPGFLRWMPGYERVIAYDKEKEHCEEVLGSSDIVFCLDFNTPERVRTMETALMKAKQLVLIDHHQDPSALASIVFSDTKACSTCQMVFDILVALGHGNAIGQQAATCLYAGIMTDSGSFRFGSTTPHTLEVAAELMRRGAVPEHIYGAIMDENTEDRMRLLGFALSERMQVHPQWGTAVISLSKADLERFHYQRGDTEGLVNYGLSIRGVRLAAFFSEGPDRVKISLRSKGMLPVNEFLREHFSGGGHINAAGGQSQAPLQATISRFLELLPSFVAKHPA